MTIEGMENYAQYIVYRVDGDDDNEDCYPIAVVGARGSAEACATVMDNGALNSEGLVWNPTAVSDAQDNKRTLIAELSTAENECDEQEVEDSAEDGFGWLCRQRSDASQSIEDRDTETANHEDSDELDQARVSDQIAHLAIERLRRTLAAKSRGEHVPPEERHTCMIGAFDFHTGKPIGAIIDGSNIYIGGSESPERPDPSGWIFREGHGPDSGIADVYMRENGQEIVVPERCRAQFSDALRKGLGA